MKIRFSALLAASGLTLSGMTIWITHSAPEITARILSAAETPAAPGPVKADSPRVSAEGRVVAYPGSEVVVATEVPGAIIDLAVQEKQVVERGRLIARLRSDEIEAEIVEIEGKIREAEADIRHAEREIKRERMLSAKGVGAAHLVDARLHDLEVAQARRHAAEGRRDHLVAQLKKREIRAPISGVILERHVDAGEFVSEGEKLVTIVDLDRLRIEAEVDEYDAPRLAVGAGVKIMAEGHAGESWRGRVEEIPDAVVPRRIRPEDPGRPIDARVLAVKVAFEGEVPLPLGRRVEITIDVLGDPGSRGDSGSSGDSLPKERGKSSLKGE